MAELNVTKKFTIVLDEKEAGHLYDILSKELPPRTGWPLNDLYNFLDAEFNPQ